MGLIILNLGLALINGIMSYFNYKLENYKISTFNGFACGFCLCAAFAISLNNFI